MDETEEAMKELQIENNDDGPCDCNDEECVGCFWPCDKCSSEKCGHKCRVNRQWKYEKWERQGRSNKQ